MYFLVNASPTKPLGAETSSLQPLQMHRSHEVESTGQHFL